MKKIKNNKKSCHICFDAKDIDDAKTKIINWMKDGYFHFYFNISQQNSKFIQALLNLKVIYKSISIYIIHSYLTPFWRVENITNLPIWTKSENFDREIEAWLETYTVNILWRHKKCFKIS